MELGRSVAPIHGLKIEKVPQCIMANKRQLQDLVCFVTNPFKLVDSNWYGSNIPSRTFLHHTAGLSERDFHQTSKWKAPDFWFVHQTRLTEDKLNPEACPAGEN